MMDIRNSVFFFLVADNTISIANAVLTSKKKTGSTNSAGDTL